MLVSVFNRYISTIVQFGVLAFLARWLAPDDYGLYMMCLGITYSFYYFVGFGASEAAVIEISKAKNRGDNSYILECVGSGFCAVILSVLLIACCVGALLVLTGYDLPLPLAALFFISFFMSSNGVIFNVSQVLLSLGFTSLGSFLFYPAVNVTIALLLTLVIPVNIEGVFESVAGIASAASVIVMVGALLICALAVKGRIRVSLQCFIHLIRTGAPLTLIRILHVSSFWVPTMVAGFTLGSVEAGFIGTAGRLAIAVSAVIAAIRFVIRPSLISAIAEKRVGDLEVIAQKAATLTFTASLLAVACNVLFGTLVITLFFGENFAQIAPILTVLLVSVCAEAVFGPVDEILKASKCTGSVLLIYFVGITILSLMAIFAAPYGLIYIAWAQLLYVAIIFSAMNVLIVRRYGFFVLPSFKALVKL